MTTRLSSSRERIRPGRLPLITVALICYATVSGCSDSQARSPETVRRPGSIELKGAGSTFSSLLFERWFAAYHESHPQTSVRYDAVGSGEGVRRFIGRSLRDGEAVDFGASDSAMSDAQLAETNGDTLMLPVTGGCIVLAYHLPNLHRPLKLSRAAYAQVFLGEIKRWNDARIAASNPGVSLPDLAIGRAVRQDSSGTTFAFSTHLAEISDAWRGQFRPATSINWPGDAMHARGNEGVAGLIKNFEGSIGYVGYEFAHRLSLDLATLENREGHFVEPTAQSCTAGLASADLPENLRAFVPDPVGATSYPIVTFSWALLRKRTGTPAVQNALLDLFRWCLRDGQRYAEDLGYVPLPASVAAKALKTLSAESTGR